MFILTPDGASHDHVSVPSTGIHLSYYTPLTTSGQYNSIITHNMLSSQQCKHPEAALIMTWDLNKAKLKQVKPNFHQHGNCHQRRQYIRSLLQLVQGCLQSQLQLAFGNLDYAAVFFIPEYKQIQDALVTEEVRHWTAQSEAMRSETWTSICSSPLPQTSTNSGMQRLASSA